MNCLLTYLGVLGNETNKKCRFYLGAMRKMGRWLTGPGNIFYHPRSILDEKKKPVHLDSHSDGIFEVNQPLPFKPTGPLKWKLNSAMYESLVYLLTAFRPRATFLFFNTG
jgi:hypothetical protein